MQSPPLTTYDSESASLDSNLDPDMLDNDLDKLDGELDDSPSTAHASQNMDLSELKRRAEDILEQKKLAKELDEYSSWGVDWED
jgi:hypothetical protein